MYSLALQSNRRITSAQLQRALSLVDCEIGGELHGRRMGHLGAIEEIEARGIRYANQDFDVLSAALNFLDAVDQEHGLRN